MNDRGMIDAPFAGPADLPQSARGTSGGAGQPSSPHAMPWMETVRRQESTGERSIDRN